ncbi:MAG: orotate phosphoribosyltransferase [Verrucomicrobiota bacterium]
MDANEVLAKFKETKALLEGHFILRSGLRSRQYFQCAGLLQHPVIAADICSALAERAKIYEIDTVVSPAMGGILVGHEVARNLNKRHIFAEKQDGKLVMRRFRVNPGERFLVAEDVVTTGSAVKETCEVVRSLGGVVVGIVVIVDRSGDVSPDFGAPYESLLRLNVETFHPDQLPEDLKSIPAVKPGSV